MVTVNQYAFVSNNETVGDVKYETYLYEAKRKRKKDTRFLEHSLIACSARLDCLMGFLFQI